MIKFLLLFLLIIVVVISLQKILKNNITEPYDHFWDFDQAGCDPTYKAVYYGHPSTKRYHKHKAINNLHESLTTGTSRTCTNCDRYLYHGAKKCGECGHLAPFLGTDQPCGPCETLPKSLKVSQKLKDRIVVRQPFFLDNGAYLKDYYNCAYYNDFRYPKRPIPTEFAKDPEGYCCKNPTRYPCYVRYSRHDLK